MNTAFVATVAVLIAIPSVASGAVAPLQPPPPSREQVRAAVKADRDRLTDFEWAGVVRTCLLSGFGFTFDDVEGSGPSVCRAVLDIHFAGAADRDRPGSGG